MIKVHFFTSCHFEVVEDHNLPRPGMTEVNLTNHLTSNDIQSFRVGYAEVEDLGDGELQLSGIWLYNEDLGPRDLEDQLFGSTQFFEEMRSRMQDEQLNSVIYIHGFNTPLEKALLGLATIKLALLSESSKRENREANVIGYLWPSRANLLGYYNDRAMAQACGPSLARGLLKFRDFFTKITRDKACRQDIHLITHSMGAYVFRNAIQKILDFNPGALPQLFNQVILTSPDEDSDAFDDVKKLRRLPELSRRVTVYYNRGDLALVGSDEVKNNPARLGQIGPASPHTAPNNTVFVDVSQVAGDIRPDQNILNTLYRKYVQHSYAFDQATIRSDILSTLDGVSQHDAPHRVWRPAQSKFELVE